MLRRKQNFFARILRNEVEKIIFDTNLIFTRELYASYFV